MAGPLGVMLGIAASLLRMVAEYTPDDDQASACADRLSLVRADALAAVESDGIASVEFGAALARDADDPTRERRVRDAAIEAATSSAALGLIGARLIPELRLLVDIGNRSLRADLAVAAQALRAGLCGALINLRSNRSTAARHDAAPSVLEERDAETATLSDAASDAARLCEELSG